MIAASGTTLLPSTVVDDPVAELAFPKPQKRLRATYDATMLDFGPLKHGNETQQEVSDNLARTFMQQSSQMQHKLVPHIRTHLYHHLPQPNLPVAAVETQQPCAFTPSPLNPSHALANPYWLPPANLKSTAANVMPTQPLHPVPQNRDCGVPGRQGQWFSRLNTLGEPEFLFAQVPPADTAIGPIGSCADVPNNSTGQKSVSITCEGTAIESAGASLWDCNESTHHSLVTQVKAADRAPGWVQPTPTPYLATVRP